LWALEHPHIGGVFVFFDMLGAKNTVNTDVFGASVALYTPMKLELCAPTSELGHHLVLNK